MQEQNHSIVEIEPISAREAIFTYRSDRGMFDYFIGMLEGACIYFNEKIKTEELSKASNELTLKLTFDKDIYYNRNYIFNRLFSFGFIKSFGVKVGIFNFIISFLIMLPIIGLKWNNRKRYRWNFKYYWGFIND